MNFLNSILAYISRHKIRSAFIAVISSFVVSCGNFVIGGTINYGFDHVEPRLHQLSYRLTNLVKKQRPDAVVLYSCDWATAGNIVTLYNQLNDGDRSSREGRGFEINAVVYHGKKYVIPQKVASVSFSTEFGSVTFFRSGFYTYISTRSAVEHQHDEEFLVRMIGANSETEETTLSVDAFTVERTANLMADYGNQIYGPNYELEGQQGYQTRIASGGMVFGHNQNDLLVGSNSNDAIFSWIGNDHIRGLAGNDVLMGEQDANFLSGGEGGDAFWMHPALANSEFFDTIEDFSLSEGDVLVLDGLVSGIPNNGIQDFVRLKASSSELVVLINSDGKGEDFFPVALLSKNENFDPLSQNIVDLISEGYIQIF